MNLVNFMVWLLAGALIGWLACRMVEEEKKRLLVPVPAGSQDSSRN